MGGGHQNRGAVLRPGRRATTAGLHRDLAVVAAAAWRSLSTHRRRRRSGRAAATASRNARKTYANVPSPSPEFDRLEPSLENRGADPDAPYSYDESIEEAERYAPQSSQMPQPPTRSRVGSSGDREPTKRVRTGAVFPFKSAIAVGIVPDPGRRRNFVGKSRRQLRHRLFKSSPVVKRQRIRQLPCRGQKSRFASASRRRRIRLRP